MNSLTLINDYIQSILSHTDADDFVRVPTMKLSLQIKPISYLKAHAADIVRQLSEQKQPLIITQNGEAKIVVQDIKSYEENEETLALLKILALGNNQIELGNVTPAKSVHEHIRLRRKRKS